MRIPLVDLRAQHATIASEVTAAVLDVVERQTFVLGEPVARFERALASWLGETHAVGVASGTDALRLALVAAGIRPGDRVVTTPFTFIATAEAVVLAGAVPVFADVDPATLHLDPESVRRAAREHGARGLLVVHLFGAAAPMEALLAVAREHDLVVVEDAAQAFGARGVGGGLARCASFFPSKTLGAWGDGGAVLTGDDALAARVRSLRQHGRRGEAHVEVGTNSRLDALQAAVLEVKLRHAAAWVAERRRLARRYVESLAPLAPRVVPRPVADCDAPNPFVARFEARDVVQARLVERGIDARAYYRRLVCDEPAFASSPRTSLPGATEAARTTMALPLYPELGDAGVGEVCAAVAAALG